ncbi:type II toxin-antitoxin system RelE/ParE family toxin [Demequina pelophila]|uniref:type II toxin-antitoxin system RelE/ParE family toxin n=1 Tax=Demequina pelophila TaxID=1638984 RepID=UPI0007839A6B
MRCAPSRTTAPWSRSTGRPCTTPGAAGTDSGRGRPRRSGRASRPGIRNRTERPRQFGLLAAVSLVGRRGWPRACPRPPRKEAGTAARYSRPAIPWGRGPRKVPPGNELEAMKGDRAGQHSIRINSQGRICFTWVGDRAEDIEFVDYH